MGSQLRQVKSLFENLCIVVCSVDCNVDCSLEFNGVRHSTVDVDSAYKFGRH